MKASITAVALVLALGAASAAAAQAPPPEVEKGAEFLILTAIPAKDGATLTVTTPAFKDGADIPFENTSYRSNTFPGLSWSKGPAATKSYAVIMQDTDAVFKGDAILHWTMYNIPASVTELNAESSRSRRVSRVETSDSCEDSLPSAAKTWSVSAAEWS